METTEYLQYKEPRLHDRPGFSCNIYLCSIPLDFPKVDLHWHDQMEIIYIKKGSGRIQVSLRNYRVDAGCIVPVLPGELHAISCARGEEMEYENIIFSLSVLDSSDPDDWCRDHVLRRLKEHTLLFERVLRPGTAFHEQGALALDSIDRVCAVQNRGYSLLVKAELFRFLHCVYEHSVSLSPDQRQEEGEKLKKILTWIREHYAEQLSVDDAAAVSGYSPSHFMRLFREQTGRTFLNWLTEYRLSTAAVELRETDKTVSQIAQTCGFDSLSYFDRKFRGQYGVSPKEYRKRQSLSRGSAENT